MSADRYGKWWENGFFGLHYDLHALAEDTRLGAELTHEHLREQLAKVKPDFVQCDCKGHPGYTSYPTKVGTASPGIVRDALRIHRDVTHELGIPLSVHYSGIRDAIAVELHPGWAALDPSGKPLAMFPNRASGMVCPRGPYLEQLMIPQLIEIIDEYDVDGFWIDGDNWGVRDCYCPRCREEFSKRTGIKRVPEKREEPEWAEWRAFQRDSFMEYVGRYTDAVHARKSDCAVCSNWLYTMRHPGPVKLPVDYLSGDFSSSYGCERAEMEGRYIDGHRMPWNLMAWTFCRPADELPHQMKTATHLCQEMAEVMSCGGSVFLYNQPQRTGWLTSWHQDIFAEVAAFCRARQLFCQHTQSVPEAVVLFSDEHVWKHNTFPFCMGECYYGLEGALHILIENQIHADVLDETRLMERISQYTLVVVSEQDPVSKKMLAALTEYVRQGGTLLMSGAHLADLCPELTGVTEAEAIRNTEWHLPFENECVGLAGPWRPVRITKAEAYAPVMREQQMGKDETEFPGVTIHRIGKGCVVAIHGNFMRSYFLGHHPRQRQFLRQLLESLNLKWKCRVDAPPSIEVTLREKPGLLLINLVNRAVSPTLTPRLHIVEEVPRSGAITVSVRLAIKPQAVVLEPERRSVAWSYQEGWLTAKIDSIHMHEILVILI